MSIFFTLCHCMLKIFNLGHSGVSWRVSCSSGDPSRWWALATRMAQARPAWALLLAIWVVLPNWLSPAKVSSLIERISDPKDLKKLLRTQNNMLVLYSKSEAAAEHHLRFLSTVAQAVKGQGTICWVNCGDTGSRKLCKMKVDLNPKDKKVKLFHYQDGAFHTEYNRAVTLKSVVAFLKDPKGPPLWEEDPGAKDVVQVDNEKDFRRLLKKEEKLLLMMFYAPWCGVCKRIMPHFQKAETQLRGHFVLAGMNVYPSEFENIKEEYNVHGYPTICYFEKGHFLFQYDNYGSTAEDIVEWLKNLQLPQPQVPETPWADEGSSIYHLTDGNFDQFGKEHSSVLIMFHAPWCGHCKKMKPEFKSAAEVLHGEAESSGVLAAVSATVNKALAERFHISEFPTLKYFKNGEKYAVPALRTKKFIEWIQNPKSPLPPEPTWKEQQTNVFHLAGDNFQDTLKKKKHTLVKFYAPWCPHCKKVIPHFTAAADAFEDDQKIACGAMDCVKDGNQDLCQQESVKAYPTFHYYHYGKFAEKYDGDLTELAFTNFIQTLREGDLEKLGKRKEELYFLPQRKLSHYTVNDTCFVVLSEFPHVLKTKFFIAASGLLYNFEIKSNHLFGGVVYSLGARAQAYAEMENRVSSISHPLGSGKPHFTITSVPRGLRGTWNPGICQPLESRTGPQNTLLGKGFILRRH